MEATQTHPLPQVVLTGYPIRAGGDGTARVWQADTGVELLNLNGHGVVKNVAFSPDNTRLVLTSLDGTARVYILDLRELASLASTRVSRHDLTPNERKRYLHEVEKK